MFLYLSVFLVNFCIFLNERELIIFFVFKMLLVLIENLFNFKFNNNGIVLGLLVILLYILVYLLCLCVLLIIYLINFNIDGFSGWYR